MNKKRTLHNIYPMKEFNLYDFCQCGDASQFEMTVKQAVIAKCFDCCGFDATEVRECTARKCSLYELRKKWCPSSVRPKREYTEEEIEQIRERLKKNRNKNI